MIIPVPRLELATVSRIGILCLRDIQVHFQVPLAVAQQGETPIPGDTTAEQYRSDSGTQLILEEDCQAISEG